MYRTAELTSSQATALRALEADFDFWKSPASGRAAEVAAGPHNADALKAALADNGVQAEVKIKDVQA